MTCKIYMRSYDAYKYMTHIWWYIHHIWSNSKLLRW